MKDENKHKIASAIYNVTITTKKVIVNEFKFIWKPLLLGIVICAICCFIAYLCDEIFGVNQLFNKQDEIFLSCGLIGILIPAIYMYYKRLKNWVLKWK